MHNRKEESKTGRTSKSDSQAHTKADSKNQEGNLKIWVGQTGTGQNLGREGGADSKGPQPRIEWISAEIPERTFRIMESSRPSWASIQNSNDITHYQIL